MAYQQIPSERLAYDTAAITNGNALLWNTASSLFVPGTVGGGPGGGAGTGFTSTTTAGTVIVGTLDTNGLSMGVPAFLTTYVNDLTSGRAGVGETTTTQAGTALGLTVDTNGVNIAYPNWITTYANDLTSGRAGVGETVGTIAGTDLAMTVNTDGVSIGYPKWITTAAAADHLHGNPTLALTNLSGTTNSASNGLTISLAAAAPGGANTMSFWENFGYLQGTQTQQIAGSTHHVQPFVLPYAISASFFRVPVSIALGSTSNATSTSAATRGGTIDYLETHFLVIYTRNAGASSQSLASVASTQAETTRRVYWTIAGNGTQMSSVYAITYQQLGNQTNTAFSSSESTNTYRFYSSHYSNFSALKFLDIPLNTLLTQGAYWFAYARSTATASSGTTTSNLSVLTMNMSIHAASQINAAYNIMGSTTNSSMHFLPGLGSWTTNTVARTTASIPFGQISTSASHLVWPIQIIRIT